MYILYNVIFLDYSKSEKRLCSHFLFYTLLLNILILRTYQHPVPITVYFSNGTLRLHINSSLMDVVSTFMTW